jgi:hypothetical protein
MATSPRQAEKEMNQAARDISQATQEATRKIAEDTSRAARAAADAGAGAARAGAGMVQRNAETVQEVWESGSKMAGQLTERSMERFARAFGMTGEGAQQATEQSARNLESIVQSGTIFAGGWQSISREWFDFARKRLEQNMHRLDDMATWRTPQELMAAHSDLMRDNLEDFVQRTRRVAEISIQMADEAVRRISDASLAPR